MELARDLLQFVAASPSPYHAVAEMARRLERSGFARLDERDVWKLQAEDARYVVRDGSSIIAMRIGRQPPSDAGMRLIGAHTDSPTLKVRPVEDIRRHGFAQVGVEPYGAPLTYTWLDRDLSLAGRLAVHDGERVVSRLVHLDRPLLRIPSLAIHLSRELRDQALKLDPQRHLVPVLGADDAPSLRALVAEHCGVPGDAIVAHDLVTVDTQPPVLGGVDGTAMYAPRLDNLASCHAGLHALCTATDGDATQVFVANDHEEVSSGSAEGARGPFLEDTLQRVIEAVDGPGREPATRALARSLLVSADMAHAVHPNYAERHEPAHQPRLGGGPVIKLNAHQSYATDAGSAGWFVARARDVGVVPQHFVVRADMPCGSTIGPLTATRLGIQTVDVGNPTLSMHSCREQASATDVAPMIAVMRAHLSAETAPGGAGGWRNRASGG
ncbi:MAG TPA: M18 family aminopeptidase [Euzebyales bacterium]|nr:M18 family aminopeptidase [Euzebyales bacterium]